MSHDANNARSESFSPRPSRVTSPAIVLTRAVTDVEVVAVRRSEPVERVVLEDLPFGALCRRGALAVSDEQDQLAAGDRAQQSLDERGADESGGAGDGDPLPRECFGDHG